MNAGPRENVAQFIGDVRPASDELVDQVARSVSDRRDHVHPKWEDLYCSNLAAWAGERVAPVLRRLVDAEAELERLRARVTELEQDSAKLAALNAAGVDNWEGYSAAFEGGDW